MLFPGMEKYMQKLTFSVLSPYLVGRGGTHWPEYGGSDRVFIYGLFRNEAKFAGIKEQPNSVGKIEIAPSAIGKYLNGSACFHRKLRHKYVVPNGDALLYANIARMVSDCPCLSHLLEVQEGVYRLLNDCDLPQETYVRLTSLYVPDLPATDDIARFLTRVLHTAILAS